MKGDFKMNLNSEANSNYELFGVPQERCKELCGLVDKIQESKPEWNIGQVIAEASNFTQSENENRLLIAEYFMDYGVHIGAQAGFKAGQVAASFFDRTVQHRQHGLKVRRPQMN